MNPKSRQRLTSIKHGFRHRIDPRERERQVKQLLPECFEKTRWLNPRSKELAAANYCGCVFLADVMNLVRFDFWDTLQGTELPFLPPPYEELSSARQKLKKPGASIYDLIGGMDIASLAVRSMVSRFSSGKFYPDEDWDLEETDEQEQHELENEEYEDEQERARETDRQYARYKCAALLPLLQEIAEEVWPSLKKRIAASEPSKKDAESE
jgi:hypothetical protein